MFFIVAFNAEISDIDNVNWKQRRNKMNQENKNNVTETSTIEAPLKRQSREPTGEMIYSVKYNGFTDYYVVEQEAKDRMEECMKMWFAVQGI